MSVGASAFALNRCWIKYMRVDVLGSQDEGSRSISHGAGINVHEDLDLHHMIEDLDLQHTAHVAQDETRCPDR